MRLVHTAKQKGNERLNLLIQTICGTGIRVSELQFITVEAVKCGEAVVSLKGKTRSVFIVRELQKKLLRYAAEQKIATGAIFITQSGKPMSRTNIWREMKSLCAQAGVNPQKYSPIICATFSPAPLRNRKRYCQARRYSRSQQYQHYTNLYYHYRQRTPSAYGKYAVDNIKIATENGGKYIIHIML